MQRKVVGKRIAATASLGRSALRGLSSRLRSFRGSEVQCLVSDMRLVSLHRERSRGRSRCGGDVADEDEFILLPILAVTIGVEITATSAQQICAIVPKSSKSCTFGKLRRDFWAAWIGFQRCAHAALCAATKGPSPITTCLY